MPRGIITYLLKSDLLFIFCGDFFIVNHRLNNWKFNYIFDTITFKWNRAVLHMLSFYPLKISCHTTSSPVVLLWLSTPGYFLLELLWLLWWPHHLLSSKCCPHLMLHNLFNMASNESQLFRISKPFYSTILFLELTHRCSCFKWCNHHLLYQKYLEDTPYKFLPQGPHTRRQSPHQLI